MKLKEKNILSNRHISYCYVINCEEMSTKKVTLLFCFFQFLYCNIELYNIRTRFYFLCKVNFMFTRIKIKLKIENLIETSFLLYKIITEEFAMFYKPLIITNISRKTSLLFASVQLKTKCI